MPAECYWSSSPTRTDGRSPAADVDAEESPRAAAAREVKEELGLDVDVSAMLVA